MTDSAKDRYVHSLIQLRGIVADAQMIVRSAKSAVNVAKERGINYDKDSFVLGLSTILEVVQQIELDFCSESLIDDEDIEERGTE